MQDSHLYEYAVIRVVPRVEREEFLNIGIILFCKRAKFIKVLHHINDAKIEALSNDFDIEQLMTDDNKEGNQTADVTGDVDADLQAKQQGRSGNDVGVDQDQQNLANPADANQNASVGAGAQTTINTDLSGKAHNKLKLLQKQ